MTFQANIPPSMLVRMSKKEESANEGAAEAEAPTGKRREDYKKSKELEEARKAGTAPAMKDEEGHDINPHIPQYIMQAPWYIGAMTPTLRHQRTQAEKMPEYSKLDEWYTRGVKEKSVATKFRKGACENCGAVTHAKKDCLERPRKIGAKFTGTDIAPDEFLQPNLNLDFDGKRDRWNGYDPGEYKRVVDEYKKIDEAKRILKAQRLEEALLKGEINEEEAKAKLEAKEDDEEEEDIKYVDDVSMPGQKMDSKERITVRNLRIREDTAKYLYNLDVNSAFYDPKTRSMRENPFLNTGKDAKELPYAGDNFVRFSGDAMNIAKQQLFAWEAYEKGTEVHLQADPTRLEILNKEFSKKKVEQKTNIKGGILDRYGGEEYLDAPPKELLLAQTENYVEYSRHGTVIKGQEKAKVMSRYEEDTLVNNHTSVWGSYWKEGLWGYRCCHSHVKESYCTGVAGKQALQASIPSAPGVKEDSATTSDVITKRMSFFKQPSPSSKTSKDEKNKKQKKKDGKRKKNKNRKKKEETSSSSSSSSESSEESEEENDDAAREKRIQQAIKKEEARLREVEKTLAVNERKRKYNVTYDAKAPTEEEMEAFHRKRPREDDPMSKFVARDTLSL